MPRHGDPMDQLARKFALGEDMIQEIIRKVKEAIQEALDLQRVRAVLRSLINRVYRVEERRTRPYIFWLDWNYRTSSSDDSD